MNANTTATVGRPATGHIPALDGLRGIAIVAVVLTHAFHCTTGGLGSGLNAVARTGWVGVNLFFVLSGFLITGILLDSKGQPGWLRCFIARRSLRIVPLYVLFLAVSFWALPATGWLSPDQIVTGRAEQWCYWLYLSNMKSTILGRALSTPPLDVTWSLAVEEQIYLFWPLLVAFVPGRLLPRVFGSMFLFALVWRTATRGLHASIELSYGWTPACVDAFAVGALVAWWLRSAQAAPALAAFAPRVALGSGLFLAGMFCGQRHFNPFENPVAMLTIGLTMLSVLFAALIGVIMTGNPCGRLQTLLSASWLRAWGRYSYAIYLWHATVIAILEHALGWEHAQRNHSPLAAGCFTLAVCACSFLTAWLTWHLYERHFLALKQYFELPCPQQPSVVCPDSPVPAGPHTATFTHGYSI